MAEHLAERQVGLRDRDVAPQRLRDLVRACAAARRSARAILRARRSCIAKRSSISVDVVGERRRRGRGGRARSASRASRAATPCRSAARAGGRRRARRTCRRAAARSAGWRRCARSGGRRRSASPRLAVEEDRVRRRVAGAVEDLRACGRRTPSSPPSCEPARRPARRAAPAAERARHRAQRGDDVARDPVAQHQRLGELVVALGVRAEVLDHRREQVERARPRRPSGGRGCRPARGGRCAGG